MDVKKYLNRINYTGSLEPTLETLHDLTLAQKTGISYSSIRTRGAPKDNRIILTPEKLYEHMITNKGSGLCYELNGLFGWLLTQLGYSIYFARASYFYVDKYTVDYFHALLIVEFGDDRYIVDPGMVVFGPMKIAHMSIYSDNFSVYRIILHPEFDNTSNRFLIQRHKKTVLDKYGNLVKKGPGNCAANGKYDVDCNIEGSTHWVPMHSFSMDRHVLSDFQPTLNTMQDTLDIFLMGFKIEPKRIALFYSNSKLSIKEAINPLTDKILIEESAESNEEIKEIAEKYFNFKVQHPITFFK